MRFVYLKATFSRLLFYFFFYDITIDSNSSSSSSSSSSSGSRSPSRSGSGSNSSSCATWPAKVIAISSTNKFIWYSCSSLKLIFYSIDINLAVKT